MVTPSTGKKKLLPQNGQKSSAPALTRGAYGGLHRLIVYNLKEKVSNVNWQKIFSEAF
jgi:hypothetical protein